MRRFYTEEMENLPQYRTIQDRDKNTEASSASSDKEDILEVEEL